MNKSEVYPNNSNWSLNDIFNDVFQLYQKVMGYGVLLMVFVGVFFSITSFIVVNLFPIDGLQEIIDAYMKLIEGGGSPAAEERFKRKVESWVEGSAGTQFTVIGFIFVIFQALIFPLVAGFINVCREYDVDGMSSFGTLFSGFNPKKWVQFFILGLIYFLVIQLLGLVFSYLGQASFISIFFRAAINTLFIFACPLIWFKDFNAFQSITNSFKLAGGKFFLIYGIVLLMGIIGYLGFLLCVIGIAFSYPIIYVTVYSIYKHHIGFGETQDAIEEIGA